MGFVPSGRHTAALRYKSHTTRNPWYNYNFTLYSLQCTPQPTIQSYYSQLTSTHNHSKTMNIGNYGVCGWKDRCRDGNLRTYCHVSPILFGWFFVEASPTCFCIFVKCFFCNCICIPRPVKVTFQSLSTMLLLLCEHVRKHKHEHEREHEHEWPLSATVLCSVVTSWE